MTIKNLQPNNPIIPSIPDSHPQYKIIQNYIYKFTNQIGMGNFSKVFKGHHQYTKQDVAIKIIQLNSLNTNKLQLLLNTQTKILKTLSHPNIIQCLEILSSIKNCYIITELCTDGDLQQKLKHHHQIPQKSLYPIALDIYSGLKYLSTKNIIHRDIKTSNIFINNGIHKIADFGFAQISQTQFRDISVGSPIYMSPQGYINNIYGPKTDVWAFGVLLYELIQGKTPSHHCQNQSDLKQNLLKQIDHTHFTTPISPSLVDLIVSCLTIDTSQRISIGDIQNTQWMQNAYKQLNRQPDYTIDKQNSPQQSPPTPYSNPINSNNLLQQPTLTQSSTPKTSTSKYSRQLSFRNYYHQYHKLFNTTTTSQNSTQQHKKYQTHDKKYYKTNTHQHSIQKINNNSNSITIFYSPHPLHQYQPTSNHRNQSPNDKFQSLYLKNHSNNLYINSSKHRDKYPITQNYPPHSKQHHLINKYQIAKSPLSKYHQNINYNQKTSRQPSKNKQKYINNYSLYHNYKQFQQSQRSLKKDRGSTPNSINIKTMVNSTSPNTHHSNRSHQPKHKYLQYIHPRILKPLPQNTLQQPQPSYKNIQLAKNFTSKTNSTHQIISRNVKFIDCIGLIHYCRLCYKFICLLNQYDNQSQSTKIFLINWSVQLLSQLSNKIDHNQILYTNDLTSSINIPQQQQKKTKLKDVTKQYLIKYSSFLKKHQKAFIPLKQASTFIYNLYLIKGHEYKQLSTQQQSYISYAIICYICVLDRQTRNLMQYIYQIKNTLQCKQIQKLLTMKIHQFCKENIFNIINFNQENILKVF